MNGVKIGKVGQSANSETDEGSEDQDEENMCKSTIERRRTTQSLKTRDIGRG